MKQPHTARSFPHRALRAVAARIEWAFRPRGKRRVLVLVAGLAALIGWQSRHLGLAHEPTFRNSHAVAMTNDRDYLFFFWHLGLYPLKTTAPIKADTRAEAERHLRELAPKLLMDDRHAFRMGDRGQLLLYLPGALLTGSSLDASANPANAGAFIAALCALFAAFWRERRLLLGAMMVLLIGSNPAVLHETFYRGNVFGWAITTATLLLALHLSLLHRAPSRLAAWLVPIASGVLLASVRTLRSDSLPLAVSALAVYLLARAPWRRRLLMCTTLAGTFAVATLAWNTYFKVKFDEASRVLALAGGVPYTGPFTLYHPLWHNLALGLGDFDRKYGYQWADHWGYVYGTKVLREKYGMQIPPFNNTLLFLQKSYDGGGRYLVLPEELPHYYEVMRQKVLDDVSRDPAWYLGILARRVKQILTVTTPLQVSFGAHKTRLPWTFLPVLPLLALLLATRRRFLIGLILFPLPLSTVPLLIYSLGGATYTAISHLVGAAIIATGLLLAAYLPLRHRLMALRPAMARQREQRSA